MVGTQPGSPVASISRSSCTAASGSEALAYALMRALYMKVLGMMPHDSIHCHASTACCSDAPSLPTTETRVVAVTTSGDTPALRIACSTA